MVLRSHIGLNTLAVLTSGAVIDVFTCTVPTNKRDGWNKKFNKKLNKCLRANL